AQVFAKCKAHSVEELWAEPWPSDADGLNVGQKVASMVGSIKENITLRRFARYEAPANATIGTYIHAGGKVGVMVEVVANVPAKADEIAAVAKDVAMHVAAAEPRFVGRDDVTQKDLDTES